MQVLRPEALVLVDAELGVKARGRLRGHAARVAVDDRFHRVAGNQVGNQKVECHGDERSDDVEAEAT